MNYAELIAAELDAAKALEAKGELSAEDLKAYEGHMAKAEELQAQKERFEAAKAKADKFSVPQARKSAPATPSATVVVSEPEFTKDPKKGFKHASEFFKTIYASSRSAKIDERLSFLAAAGSDEQLVGNDSYGGFLVPEGFINDVQSIDIETNPLAGRTTDIPMDSPTVGIPSIVDEDHSTSVAGGIAVYRKGETAAGTSSRAEMRLIKLSANTLFGLSYTTEELLADSPSSVAALLGQSFNKAFADKDFEELLRGTGVGQPEGFLNYNALVSVPKETSQTAATIVKENILKMRSRCYDYSNAVWICNHDTYPQIAVVGGDGNGSGNLFQNSMVEGRPDMLLGRPIYFSEYAETLGVKGDIMLIAPRNIYTGNYQPLESAESIHVRFVEHERAFKFFKRNDARSAWTNALTPRKGAASLSPFVTLAARA